MLKSMFIYLSLTYRLENSWASIHHNHNVLYSKAKTLDGDIERLNKLAQDTTGEIAIFKKELDLFPEVLNCIVDCKNHIEKMAFSFRVFEETLYRLSVVKKEADMKVWNGNREKEENAKTKKKQDEVAKTEKKLKKAFDDHQKKLEKED